MNMAMWSPILRQSFVTSGVSLNIGSASLVMGFTAGFLEQLSRPDSSISIDYSSGSWIAAVPAISNLLGNLISAPIVARYGRKPNNLLSSVFLAIGWLCMYFGNSVTMLLAARFLKGFGLGLNFSSGPLLVGEYSSPRYRGVLLTTIAVSCTLMSIAVHQMVLNLNWRLASLICVVYTIGSMVIMIFSPESPSWLISKGRYEEGRTVFRWLRGEHEEEELERVIEADVEFMKTTRKPSGKQPIMKQIYNKMKYYQTTVIKKEFYKPIIIMIHLFAITHWCGINIFSSYADIIFRKVNLKDFSLPLTVMIADIVRSITMFLIAIIIKRWKRRVIYFTSAGLNIFMFLLIAAYTYVREIYELSFDHPALYLFLTIVLIASSLPGPASMSFLIFGEIIPLEYKNLAGTISVTFFSIHFFLAVKTFPYFINNLEVYGTYCVCAVILVYCVLVVWFTLPETKDRTLQDIEDHFRGRSARPGQARPLTVWGTTDAKEGNTHTSA